MVSIEISLVTAILGGILGFLLAYAVISGGLPRPLRTVVMTFSGVASNFAGVPLALAFIFTIGRTGFITVFLKTVLGVDVYGSGFTIYSKLGLEIVYLYFQLPLMVLIIAPAIDGLKKEWREASENAGASTFQYWRHIALPILMPSLLGSMILLFGNSFGAQATAFALTGGFIPPRTRRQTLGILGRAPAQPGLLLLATRGDPAVLAPGAALPRCVRGDGQGPADPVDPHLLVRHRGHHDRGQHRPARPDGVLGPASAAPAPADRRVRDAPPLRRAPDRPRLRPHLDLQRAAPSVHRHEHRERRAPHLRLRGPVVPLHVPVHRRWAPDDRHPDADRSVPEPRRRLVHPALAGDPAQPPRLDPERRVPHPCHRRRRVHDRELPRPADVRHLPPADLGQPCLRTRGRGSDQLRHHVGGDGPDRARRARQPSQGRAHGSPLTDDDGDDPRMSYLSLTGIHKRFPNGFVAVQGFNLAMEKGEFVSFLGPSGCGKTTTLRMIAGFEHPTSGTVVVDGSDITDRPPNRRNVGMVFQAYALFPNMTVADNIGFGLKVRKRDKASIARRTTELLELIGLPGKGDRYPWQISGGQQQRVALARALAFEPQVLLLDEPLSALDAKIRVSLRAEIRAIQRTLGITTVYVTHDQEEALSLSDRIVVMPS